MDENLNGQTNFKSCHGLKQWMKRLMNGQCNLTSSHVMMDEKVSSSHVMD